MIKILILLFASAGAAMAAGQDTPAPYDQRAEAAALVESLAAGHGLDPAWVRARLAEAVHQPEIIAAMRRPAEKTLAWYEYRRIFLKPDRIKGGAAFLRQHAPLFERAEQRFGVPGHVIAAIIGVETRYGGFVGRNRVLDALATLGFDYPPRAEFFRSELREFLLLAREEDLDIDTVVGSYAGAMGLPQFIASSYRAYAVDFNGNGRRDLWSEPADIIGSVANYLSEHGWRAGEPTILPAAASAEAVNGLQRSRRKTRYQYSELAAAGVNAAPPPPADTKVGLVELASENGPEYWLGLNNFFVITTYNHSRLYAMAVHQLGEAIAAEAAKAGEVAAQ